MIDKSKYIRFELLQTYEKGVDWFEIWRDQELT